MSFVGLEEAPGGLDCDLIGEVNYEEIGDETEDYRDDAFNDYYGKVWLERTVEGFLGGVMHRMRGRE